MMLQKHEFPHDASEEIAPDAGAARQDGLRGARRRAVSRGTPQCRTSAGRSGAVRRPLCSPALFVVCNSPRAGSALPPAVWRGAARHRDAPRRADEAGGGAASTFTQMIAAQAARMRDAFRRAGQEAVTGFREVLEAMMDEDLKRLFEGTA